MHGLGMVSAKRYADLYLLDDNLILVQPEQISLQSFDFSHQLDVIDF